LLAVKINGDNTKTEILNIHPVFEQYNLPEYLVENNFRTVKRTGNKALSLTSYVRYASLPQKLAISNDTSDFIPRQSILHSGFYTSNKTSFSYSRGNSRLSLNLNLEASFEDMDSKLISLVYTDSTHNDLSFDFVKFSLLPVYTYKKGDLLFTLRTPIVQQNIFIKDLVYNKKSNLNLFSVNPDLSIKYDFTQLLSGTFTTQYSDSQTGNVFDFTQSYFMQNYRTIKGPRPGILNRRNEQSYTLYINYQDFLKFLFLNANISYSSSLINMISGQNFENSNSILSVLEKDSRHKNLTYRINGRKYIGSLRSNVSLSSSYTLSETERMQQETFFPYKTATWTLDPKIDIKISNKTSVAYEEHYTNSKRKIEAGEKGDNLSINQVTRKFSCLYSTGNFSSNIQIEHLRNDITKDVSSGLFFADAEAGYHFRNIEISLLWNNIFNKKEYAYTISEALDVYSYHYRLRPTNILARVAFKY
jgi:hypothetical protein